MLRHLCGLLLGVLMVSDLGKPHDVMKRSSDLGTESMGVYDPCFRSRYVAIDNYRRGVYMGAQALENVIDDERIPYYWYRFMSGIGGEIPTSCPAVGQCNAIFPMWMKGTIPPDDDEAHMVQMCVNDNSDPKCEYRCQDTLIKNCTDFLVYKLRPPPTQYAAYCAGNGRECEPGEDSPTGFTPCERVENIPAAPKPPMVDIDPTDPKFFFGVCTLTDPDLTVEHDVRWIAGGNVFHRQTVLRGERVARVSELDMFFRGHSIIGNHLSCEVSARKQGYEVGSKFTRSEGPGFFLGTQLQFVNEEGNEVRHLAVNRETVVRTFLYVKTTVPVRCNDRAYNHIPDFLKPQCEMSVVIENADLENYLDQFNGDCTRDELISPKQIAAQINFGRCRQSFTEADWNDYRTHKISVSAIYGRNSNGLQARYIAPRISSPYQRVQDLYSPPWVKVTSGARSSACTSFNSHHMTTFDGQEYEKTLVGEFVLYENVDLNFRVHAYFIKCNDIGSCNCAVAAQAGDDVILLDRCNKFGDIVFDNDDHIAEEDKGQGYMRQKVLPLGDMTPGFALDHTAETNVYTIQFPHGAALRVTLDGARTEYVNLRMFPSQEDFAKYEDPQKVRGLCGTFSGDRRDDFLMRDGSTYQLQRRDRRNNWIYPNEFIEDWRIPAGDPRTMYNGKILHTSNNYKHKLCACVRVDGVEKLVCQFKSLCDEDVGA